MSTATRNRSATEARILAAVGEVLARDGFARIGINAIARQAGVDKVLIYRYFEGLPNLLRCWGASGCFWPTLEELLRLCPANLLELPLAERYGWFFASFIDALRQRPLTIEILAGEVSEPNSLTEILDQQRETWGQQVVQLLSTPEQQATHQSLLDLSSVLIAGVQYLLIRARATAEFGGLALQTDAGWERIKVAIRVMAQSFFCQGTAEAA